MSMKFSVGFIGALALAVVSATPFAQSAGEDGAQDGGAGSVYTMTNAVSGNRVVVFDRDGHGGLTPGGSVATGGLGSGGGLDALGSQGSLVLSDNKVWLLAVNAGSNDISVLRVRGSGLEPVQRIASGGVFPTSVTVFHDLVYVLNSGGTPNITGFTLDHSGELSPIAGSTRTLGAGLYASVGFDAQGEALVVSYRSANMLLVYGVGKEAMPAIAPVATASHRSGPFEIRLRPTGPPAGGRSGKRCRLLLCPRPRRHPGFARRLRGQRAERHVLDRAGGQSQRLYGQSRQP